jgi:hypothetical protein
MKLKITLLLGLILPTILYGQNQSLKNNETAKFIRIEAGLNPVKFRDFATSPLFYKGSLKKIGLYSLKEFDGKEREFGISYAFGATSNTTNDHTSASQMSIIDLSYSKMYTVKSDNNWNIKIGGKLQNTAHIRNNPSFQNNATGIEIFSTLMASGKVSRDISNKTSKEFKFLFIPFRFKARKRSLSFRLNLAAMNNTYRNGYIYNGQSAITNNAKLFDNYKFNFFSGYRFGTELNYRVYYKNKNAIQIGYTFDGYRTGGKFDKFEIAQHNLKISLLFKTK